MDNFNSIDFALYVSTIAKSLPPEKRAILGEVNAEKIEPFCKPPEWLKEQCKELFKDVKKEDIELYIDGKKVNKCNNE